MKCITANCRNVPPPSFKYMNMLRRAASFIMDDRDVEKSHDSICLQTTCAHILGLSKYTRIHKQTALIPTKYVLIKEKLYFGDTENAQLCDGRPLHPSPCRGDADWCNVMKEMSLCLCLCVFLCCLFNTILSLFPLHCFHSHDWSVQLPNSDPLLLLNNHTLWTKLWTEQKREMVLSPDQFLICNAFHYSNVSQLTC